MEKKQPFCDKTRKKNNKSNQNIWFCCTVYYKRNGRNSERNNKTNLLEGEKKQKNARASKKTQHTQHVIINGTHISLQLKIMKMKWKVCDLLFTTHAMAMCWCLCLRRAPHAAITTDGQVRRKCTTIALLLEANAIQRCYTWLVGYQQRNSLEFNMHCAPSHRQTIVFFFLSFGFFLFFFFKTIFSSSFSKAIQR